MATQRTLSLIKPDGLEKGLIGKIVARFEERGLKPVALKLLRLTPEAAEGFYAVHRQRPFFKSLVASMTSGPILALVLEGDEAVAKNREIMGATDPAKAVAGTIRKDFATDVEKNTVHGSDSPENAAIEIAYFFNAFELQAYDWKAKR
jgi:nucleoside-diphosphate kinase